MKKVSKIFLNENAKILEKDEMKLILGGWSYRCCCGMGYTYLCDNIVASNIDAAIYQVGMGCDSGGGCYY